jgi:hypothetical protein
MSESSESSGVEWRLVVAEGVVVVAGFLILEKYEKVLIAPASDKESGEFSDISRSLDASPGALPV